MAKHDDYPRIFAHLRTDTSASRWTTATCHRAPHKPLLLLAVMDLMAQGAIRSNLIEPSLSLIEVVDLYWKKVIGHGSSTNLALPFSHLQSDGFWHLMPLPGMETALATVKHPRSLAQLRRFVLGATLDEPLFMLLQDSQQRDSLRRILIETYFAPEVRPALVEVGRITAESFEYSHELLDRTRERFQLRDAPQADERYLTESRSTAFRRVIVDAYDHTCALCGIRIVTAEGRTAVSAAHIVPWSLSHNDDPRNGMALCGLHHWTFDQGVVSLKPDYCIELSPTLPTADERIHPLLSLGMQTLRRPDDTTLWPAVEAIDWHRKHVFRK
jgi:putative restriction endonuclease